MCSQTKRGGEFSTGTLGKFHPALTILAVPFCGLRNILWAGAVTHYKKTFCNVGDNMYFSSKFVAWRVLAVALALTLWGFGSPALRAEEGQGCPQKTCPAPKPVCPAPKPPEPICCPAPVLHCPAACPAEPSCPCDPKEIAKAQKEAEHAQHEAAEACRRQQRAAQKAQERINRAAERGNADVARANAHLEHEKSEAAEANARLESLTGNQ